ncbi:MAG: DNA-binding protein [bacterium]|nr:DNA-binding protein [bacterium]MDE0374349.1 DNA-binding protein [bacterium]
MVTNVPMGSKSTGVKVFDFDPGRIHLLSFGQGDDLLDSLTAFARCRGILAATITFLGSVSRADLSWYDPDAGDYRTIVREEQLEVAGGTGNISLYEGQPLVHIHAAFADPTGMTIGGHINPGTTVFAMEATVQELVGDPPEFWGTL